ncbi:MAG: hypothetical protein OEZ32_06150 [Nitrospinota bacterium]|nr:hypothetical protein [Nitrospinota bacterium]
MNNTVPMELDCPSSESAKVENAFMFGVMECHGCNPERGEANADLHVRLVDGDVYRVEANDVSKTIGRIHGLFCGKTIHISGRIDREAKAIKLNKVRALGSSRGLMVRRLIEAGGSSFQSDKVLRAGMY